MTCVRTCDNISLVIVLSHMRTNIKGENMSEFSNYLKERRLEKNITLRKMAKDLEISVSYLSDIESGHKMAPNSKEDKYKNLIDQMATYLELSEDEREKLVMLADKDLIDRGHMSNDITSYIGQTPLASVALRKAKESNLTDEDWKKIINNMDK